MKVEFNFNQEELEAMKSLLSVCLYHNMGVMTSEQQINANSLYTQLDLAIRYLKEVKGVEEVV